MSKGISLSQITSHINKYPDTEATAITLYFFTLLIMLIVVTLIYIQRKKKKDPSYCFKFRYITILIAVFVLLYNLPISLMPPSKGGLEINAHPSGMMTVYSNKIESNGQFTVAFNFEPDDPAYYYSMQHIVTNRTVIFNYLSNLYFKFKYSWVEMHLFHFNTKTYINLYSTCHYKFTNPAAAKMFLIKNHLTVGTKRKITLNQMILSSAIFKRETDWIFEHPAC